MKHPSHTPAALLDALRDPASLTALEPHGWEQLLRDAEALRLATRMAWQAEAVDVAPGGCIGDRLCGLRARGAASDQTIRWEFSRIAQALRTTRTIPVALKGAAYVLLDLPFARGRRVADVDVLVPRADLSAVEAALLAAGWVHRPLHPYDDRYYRLWTHELPPMVHGRRRVPLDMHHGLVPTTSRLQPDPARVLERSVLVPGAGARVPCPAHLVLHAAVHLFHDGEIAGALRDLVDIDGLLAHYGPSPSFWNDFCAEAEAWGAERPAFYALRYSGRMLATHIPADVRLTAERWAPRRRVLAAMDYLVPRALVRRDATLSLPGAVLRARAHGLRMPPGLLARHLAIKTYRRMWHTSEQFATA